MSHSTMRRYSTRLTNPHGYREFYNTESQFQRFSDEMSRRNVESRRGRRRSRAAEPAAVPSVEPEQHRLPQFGVDFPRVRRIENSILSPLANMQVSFVEDLLDKRIFTDEGAGQVIFNPERFYQVCTAPGFDGEVRHLFNILNSPARPTQNRCCITPTGLLRIPLRDVYNLRCYIMVYLLWKISQYIHDRQPANNTFITLFSRFSSFPSRTRNQGVNRGALRVGRITLSSIVNVYDQFIGALHTQVISSDGALSDPLIEGHRITEAHTHSEESGDRIMILVSRDLSSSGYYYLNINIIPGNQYRFGSRWNPYIEEMVKNGILKQAGVVTVKNVDDDLCMFYCIALGIALRESPLTISFGYTDVLSPDKICALVSTGSTPIAKSILEKAISSYGTVGMKKLLEDNFSLQDFCEIMERVEKSLPIAGLFAIDVYMQNSEKSIRIYPAYMSKNTTRERIKILLVNCNRICHSFLIRDIKKLFRKTGGKIFYTCYECYQAFYTASLLMNHSCKKRKKEEQRQKRKGEVFTSESSTEEKSEWHPSMLGLVINDDCPSGGLCRRCFLESPDDDFSYDYHRKHCLMEGRRVGSYRHVQLVDAEHNHLKQTTEEKERDEPVIYFADFESIIPQGDGDENRDIDGEIHHTHQNMSYGIYSVKDKCFQIGYNIEEFMNMIFCFGFQNKRTIIYFHNAMNYDVYFIIRTFLAYKKEGKDGIYSDWNMKVLMKSVSCLQTVSFFARFKDKGTHVITIGDTCKFLPMSLERIVDSVRKPDLEENKEVFPLFFEVFRSRYPSLSDEVFDGVLYKNLFPYNYFDSGDKLDVEIDEFERIFEPREENLKYFAEGLSLHDLEENFGTFKSICKDFHVRTARDYHDIYLTCDVMQITDVFLASRNIILGSHKIDLCDYIGMPSATWAAWKKFTNGLDLQLYTWTFFAEFFSSMTRGGVTSAPLRYAKSDDTHSILYLDVNGLYPYVMQQYPYPLGDFKLIRLKADEIKEGEKDWNKYFLDKILPMLRKENKGACFCVDMVIRPEYINLTDQYPLAPNHEIIKDEFLDLDGQMYEFMRRFSEKNKGVKPATIRGLVCSLKEKNEYGVHWRLLEWYVNHGMKILKIHFYITFTEEYYLRDYVKMNIERRNQEKTPLGKTVYKFIGNSLYGKTFERTENRGDHQIIDSQERLIGMIEEGNVSSITQIDENYSIVQLEGGTVKLDLPTYIGPIVTEMAKLHMYSLLYDKLIPAFNGKARLVYTDTDSFIILVEHKPGFDAIKYLKEVPIKGEVLIGSEGGKIKSETGDDRIEEVIALRPKVYTYKVLSKNKDTGEIEVHYGKRAKGTTAAAQDTQLDWECYERALKNLEGITTTNLQFVRDRFTISTEHIEKLSLTANDGKRYICRNGVETLAWGNPKILTDKVEADKEKEKRMREEEEVCERTLPNGVPSIRSESEITLPPEVPSYSPSPIVLDVDDDDDDDD